MSPGRQAQKQKRGHERRQPEQMQEQVRTERWIGEEIGRSTTAGRGGEERKEKKRKEIREKRKRE